MSDAIGTPEDWTPEAWHEQMHVDIAVAYRLSELGYIDMPDDAPYDAEETARIDAEYQAWLAEVKRQVAERAWREGVRSAFGRSIEDPYWAPADIQDLNQYRKDGE